MATTDIMPPRSDSEHNRDAIAQMVSEFRQTLNRFTVEVLGVEYDGKTVIIVDKTGGVVGRMDAAIRAQRRTFWYLLGFLLFDKGIANAKQIGDLLELVRKGLGGQ